MYIVILLTTIAVCVGLGISWVREIGWKRASIAACIRLGWLIPIVWSLQPETITEKMPNTLVQQPIHILLDDSASMTGGKFGGKLNSKASDTIEFIEKE
ncbi:MAG: hypothetical protein NT027_17440 [Proteobacteria bacterium]|nr:hypothetical protein [Pseudomonadota bacterium]